jgi:hypothetical protein
VSRVDIVASSEFAAASRKTALLGELLDLEGWGGFHCGGGLGSFGGRRRDGRVIGNKSFGSHCQELGREWRRKKKKNIMEIVDRLL